MKDAGFLPRRKTGLSHRITYTLMNKKMKTGPERAGMGVPYARIVVHKQI